MFISKEIEKLYNERFDRYVTAMNGGMPDRVPIRFLLQETAARYAGYTNQQVACDSGMAFEATRKMAEYIGSDAAMLNAIWSNYGVGKAIGHKYYHVPGVDMDINNVQQYSEPVDPKDYFVQDNEYDELIRDPTKFIITKWLARASTRIKLPGEPVDYDHNMTLISGAMAYANYMNTFGAAAYKFKYESGVVNANSGMFKAPFDILADKFRGYIPLIYDCMERPAVVKRACEALIPHLVANAIGGADPEKNLPITFWAHRGCKPFINDEMFNDIYFPTLRTALEEIVSQGYQILFYGEGNWEAHYKDILTLPANSIIYHIDRGDPRKASCLRNKFAVSGGLDYKLLVDGSKDAIAKYIDGLFDALGRDGGYILDASALMLSDVDPERVKFAADYAREHCVYSRSDVRAKRMPKLHYDWPAAQVKSGRRPNVCRSWEEESAAYNNLTGDVDLVKRKWESVDAAAYNFAWTSVLW